MGIFSILTVVVVTEVCIFVKTDQAVPLNGRIWIVCKSLAIKLIKIMKNFPVFFWLQEHFMLIVINSDILFFKILNYF